MNGRSPSPTTVGTRGAPGSIVARRALPNDRSSPSGRPTPHLNEATLSPLVSCRLGAFNLTEQERAMDLRGPGGIIGLIILIVVIIIVLRFLGIF